MHGLERSYFHFGLKQIKTFLVLQLFYTVIVVAFFLQKKTFLNVSILLFHTNERETNQYGHSKSFGTIRQIQVVCFVP